MNINILTWSNKSNNGAFQKPIGIDIFSDMIVVKPVFTFTFTDLYYVEESNLFTVDGSEMTAEQKFEVEAKISATVPPPEWYFNLFKKFN